MKLLKFSVVAFSLFSSCSPPSVDNVTIDTNYTMYYDYFAVVYSGVNYDAYWPELTIKNSSNSEATIVFKYSFYVCGVKQTASGLNKTVYYNASKGTTYWEMDSDNAAIIRSDARCSGSLITVDDVSFDWTVLSVS